MSLLNLFKKKPVDPSAQADVLANSELPGVVKRKQWQRLVGIVLGIIGVVVTLVLLFTEPQPTSSDLAKNKVKATNLVTPGDQVNPNDAWTATAGKEIAALRMQNEELAKQQRDMKLYLEDLQKNAVAKTKTSELLTEPKIIGGTALNPQPSPAVFPSTSSLNAPTPVGYPPSTPGSATNANYSAQPVAPPAPKPIQQVSMRPEAAQKAPDPVVKELKEPATTDNYLPVSITRAILLGGLDAPTGGQSQNNPHPVILQLTDLGILPNSYRSEVKECMVIAAGYGDISSERAYMRTETLSCIRKDGIVLETPLQGSVFGEDGKVGLRGRLVTKNGQLLMNSLLAGFGAGMGRVFTQQATTNSVSALGTTSTIDPGKAFQAGLGQGVGTSLDRLSRYYISLAEKTFPIIEVDAGREVDVVITKGMSIELTPRGSGSAKVGMNTKKPSLVDVLDTED